MTIKKTDCHFLFKIILFLNFEISLKSETKHQSQKRTFIIINIPLDHSYFQTCQCRCKLNLYTMGNLLYVIAVILIIFWAIGFLGYHLGWLIHILLVIAIISLLLRVIQGTK